MSPPTTAEERKWAAVVMAQVAEECCDWLAGMMDMFYPGSSDMQRYGRISERLTETAKYIRVVGQWTRDTMPQRPPERPPLEPTVMETRELPRVEDTVVMDVDTGEWMQKAVTEVPDPEDWDWGRQSWLQRRRDRKDSIKRAEVS